MPPEGKRGPGRPALPGGASVLYVRLPLALRERLRASAAAAGIKEAEHARALLADALGREERRKARRGGE